MEIKFDTQVDALYIRLKKGRIHKTISHGNFILDVDRRGNVLGIEVLNYSKAANAQPDKYSVSFSRDSRKLIPA